VVRLGVAEEEFGGGDLLYVAESLILNEGVSESKQRLVIMSKKFSRTFRLRIFGTYKGFP